MGIINNYICGLDIGSSKISAAVVELKRGRPSGIFFDTIPAKGVKKGAIIDSIDLIGSVGRLIKNLKKKSGINIKVLHTNISGDDLVTRHSHAIMPLAERGNKVITPSDIEEVNEQARILGSNLEEEIIHAVPFCYKIDSNKSILNPVGLYSHRLEADLYLICGKTSSIQSLTRTINQAGYEIKDLFFSGLATSKAVFDKELSEGVNVLCDIGADITELVVFKDGLLQDVKIIFLGGDDLTTQLSETLKVPFDLADDIKRTYSSVDEHQQIKEDKEILVKRSNEYKPIKQKLISEIVTAKTRSMCSDIKDAVENITPVSKIDSFTITGRTVLLEGFLETLESSLGIPVKIGRIANPKLLPLVSISNELSGQKHLSYATALGIIAEVFSPSQSQSWPASCAVSVRNPILKAAYKVKEIYQEYF